MKLENKHQNIILFTIIWITMTAFTIAAYFLLDIEKIRLNNWALDFLLLAELLFCAGLIGMSLLKRRGGVFAVAGLIAILGIYFISAIFLSLFTWIKGGSFGFFIVLELAIHALLIILSTVLVLSSGRIHVSNMDTENRRDTGEMDKPKRGGF